MVERKKNDVTRKLSNNTVQKIIISKHNRETISPIPLASLSLLPVHTVCCPQLRDHTVTPLITVPVVKFEQSTVHREVISHVTSRSRVKTKKRETNIAIEISWNSGTLWWSYYGCGNNEKSVRIKKKKQQFEEETARVVYKTRTKQEQRPRKRPIHVPVKRKSYTLRVFGICESKSKTNRLRAYFRSCGELGGIFAREMLAVVKFEENDVFSGWFMDSMNSELLCVCGGAKLEICEFVIEGCFTNEWKSLEKMNLRSLPIERNQKFEFRYLQKLAKRWTIW